MSPLVFVDTPPPARTAGRRTPRSEWDNITAELRAHPGKWAVVRKAMISHALASRISTGRSAAFRPVGHYEGRSVKVGVDDQGRDMCDIYARYVGPPAGQQQPARPVPARAPGSGLQPTRPQAAAAPTTLRTRQCASVHPHTGHTWDHSGHQPPRDLCPGRPGSVTVTVQAARAGAPTTGGGLVAPTLVRVDPAVPTRPIEYPPNHAQLERGPDAPTQPPTAAVQAAMTTMCRCMHAKRLHPGGECRLAADCGCNRYRAMTA